MALARFPGREEVSQDRINILTNIVEFLDLALRKREILNYIKEDEVLSSMYWFLDICDDNNVEYKTFTPTDGSLGKVTAKARQAVAYMALCAMTGYVLELTESEAKASKKRWSKGLAWLNVSELLEGEVKDAIWDNILRLQDTIYARVDNRTVILTRYFTTKNYPPQQPTLKAVFSQLEIIFDLSQPRAVQLMVYFITLHHSDLMFPNVRKQALAFKAAFDKVIFEEGADFNTSRLRIKYNEHPDLSVYKYPDLLEATFEWLGVYGVPKSFKTVTNRPIDPDRAQNSSSLSNDSQ